ncbi:MAG: GNAT family N-acetyltransferase, partial [Peptidiphaga sp.]
GRLLDELVSAAVREGAETVFLEVRSRSEGARALYEGRGFVPVGLRSRYYRDDDALVMRRDVRR